jgi:predicted TIM-barrel enzyme/AraC-like DNA-binding protein
MKDEHPVKREEIMRRLRAHIKENGHIIAVASGSGITAKYSAKGGADIILALSAGKFRQAGRASFACYLCYGNSNDIVADFAVRELLTLIHDRPVLFGLNASDPMIDLESYIRGIRDSGLAGIANFPTASLIDGAFGEALAENGMGYDCEVRAIRIAHDIGLFTLAFVTDEEQTRMMIDAGADIICAHLGLTAGGALGARKVRSIEASCRMADRIFRVCDSIDPDIIKMVYGGPIKTPPDAQYFYDNTSCQGFIGGSSFERIPAEKAILNTTRSFVTPDDPSTEDDLRDALDGRPPKRDYVAIVEDIIEKNYHQPLSLNEIALMLHISAPYLSSLFSRKFGCSFTEYLIRFRMNKACMLLCNANLSIGEIAEDVGYPDRSQFSKIFRKYKGMPPREYRRTMLAVK